ncbi:MAG: hypothetical protein Q9166_000092 [cf. Caloplaca sp. 2 TL-2023]
MAELEDDHEVTAQFEREGIQLFSPSRRQSQHHLRPQEQPSSDEIPLDSTLASQSYLSTTTETEAVNILNRLSLPSLGIQQAKRKRSSSIGDPMPEPIKRSKTGDSNGNTASDLPKASPQVRRGKLKRPTPQLIGGKAVRVNPKDPFDVDDEQQNKHEPLRQDSRLAKRERPSKKAHFSSTLAADPEVGLATGPDAAAVPVAPSKVRRGRPPKSAKSKPVGEQPGSRRKLGDRKVDGIPQPSGEPEKRQVKPRKSVAVSSSPTDPRAGNVPELKCSSSPDREGFNVRGDERVQRRGARDNNQVDVGSCSIEPSVEAESDTSDGSELMPVQEVPNSSIEESEINATSQKLAAEEPEASDNENDYHASDGQFYDNEGQENDGQENCVRESDDQENDDQGTDEQGNVGQEGEDQDVQDSRPVSDKPKLELLGQDHVWRSINEARRKVGFSSRRGHKMREIPSIQTGYGRKIVNLIKTAAQLYDPTDQDQPRVQQQEALGDLTQSIEDLAESSNQGEESETIQDIYAHAVPSLVLLLRKALKARSRQLSDRKNTTALEEIIHLQDVLITLCQKAQGWKAKPITDRPIIRPNDTINAHVGRMRSAFSKVLDIRKQQLKLQAAKAGTPPETDGLSSQREREATIKKNGARRQMIIDDCERGSATHWGRRPVPQSQIHKSDPQPVLPQSVVEDWSKEQDRALICELLKRDLWNLSAAFVPCSADDIVNRYLDTLSCSFGNAIMGKPGPVDLDAGDAKKSRQSTADKTAGRKHTETSNNKSKKNVSAKRTAGSTPPPSATKPTMASASRNAPSGGLTKPPTRPSSNPVIIKPSLTQSTFRPSTTASKQTPTRTGRPATNPTSRPMLTGSVKRGPSVVLTSPSVVVHKPDSTSAIPNRSSLSPKKQRPGLGTRKSTMSATVEQRLREMSVVHEMLRAAMAEDGTEDDEAKAEYGKQMDETLAALRARLEEARNIEGRLTTEPQPDTRTNEEDAVTGANEVKPPPEDHGQASESTSIPHDSMSYAHRDLDGNVELLKSQSDDESLQAAKQEEVQGLRKTIDQLSKTNEVMQAKLLELQSSNELEVRRHLDTLEELRAELDQVNKAKEHAALLSEQAVASLEHEVQQLEVSKVSLQDRLQQIHESTEREARQHDEEHGQVVSALRQDLHETRCSKDRETSHLQQALEALQKTIQEVSEEKERDIDTLRYNLAAEHEEVVSNLRLELDDAFAKGEQVVGLQDNVAKSKFQLDEVRATLATLHVSNTELRHALDNAGQQHKKEVSSLKIALDDSKAEVARSLNEVTAEKLEQISSLENAKVIADTALRSTEEALKQESENAASLHRRLKLLENEYQALLERTTRVEESLNRLSNDCRAIQQLAADYQSELSQLRTDYAADEALIVQLEGAERNNKGLEQTVNALWAEIHSKDESLQILQTQVESLRTQGGPTAESNGVLKDSNLPTGLDELTAQLHLAQDASNMQEARIRELENALKVKIEVANDELVKLETKQLNGHGYFGGLVPRTSPWSRRWAKMNGDSNGRIAESDDLVPGEKLGIDVYRQLAGVREHIRQMDDMNEEKIRHDKR